MKYLILSRLIDVTENEKKSKETRPVFLGGFLLCMGKTMAEPHQTPDCWSFTLREGTGGRTKIGYHTALRFLRDGTRVIVTSCSPYVASQRYFRVSLPNEHTPLLAETA
ncbi:hypothetical protein JIR001_30870 [Polycladomyces abyssicola]|uniref:Uncharacterized protein n=1 Tax=Polycladomyces abyssicola TaxID=1125966 RepID=A0A8D5UJG8_9BACL|nr:hypothetical protein [Polycladomyces abyssicola]BCU83304.1 hypothetical protein JIR001_30870 [Polycladomyces abyssicola]